MLSTKEMKWPFGKRVKNTSPTTIDDCLSTVSNAAQKCRVAADALESTDLDSFHKASLIAQYEPNRFETDVEYGEARIARDAAVAAQDAANRLQEAALALAIALKGNGFDLSAASFAEVGSKAMKVDSSSVYDKAAALRDAARAYPILIVLFWHPAYPKSSFHQHLRQETNSHGSLPVPRAPCPRHPSHRRRHVT